MIENLLKKASLIKTPSLKGVSNIVQSCGVDDILLLPVNSLEQQSDLLSKNLVPNFNGLLVSPFSPKQDLNHLKLPKEEVLALEEPLIEFFYPLSKRLPKIIGVTGTNGKTSVCWLVTELANLCGKNSLYAGTPGVYYNRHLGPEKVLTTTPSYLSFRRLLHTYPDTEVVALEISSHALEQGRSKKIELDLGAWTNFTQDHLDYHGTMENYFNAKLKIFDLVKDGSVIVHSSEKDLLKSLREREVIQARPLPKNDLTGPFVTGFPRVNLELAYSVVERMGLVLTKDLLDRVTLPPGRFQVIHKSGKDFIVDYAHTPDALESVLKQIKQTYPDKKVCTVFGCGGDRDKKKRPIMAKAAETSSDIVIVTSDNPRSEKPEEIIDDTVKGLSGNSYFREVDREKAIELANKKTDDSWVILIAGKGHENYQEINGVRHSFDDAQVVRELK